MERPILLELERAELAARERRLAAEAEAERLVSAARQSATALRADAPAAIAEATTARRRELAEAADREIVELEREMAALGTAADAAPDEEARRRAVELVVAMVLAEPIPEGG